MTGLYYMNMMIIVCSIPVDGPTALGVVSMIRYLGLMYAVQCYSSVIQLYSYTAIFS